MRILGIDPGTATTGYGVVEETAKGYKMVSYGCITTNKENPPEARLNEIAFDLIQLIKKFKPTHAAVEDIFFSKNTKTAISVAQARGVIIQKITESGIPVTSYNPLRIKQALCSDGKADKHQIQKMVKMLLELDEIPRPDDAADGLAIALCHAHTMKNNSLYQPV